MWELFQYVSAFIVLLIGLGGAASAIYYSQEEARSSEFATAIMLLGGGWGAALAYIAYRLFGFQ